MIKSLTVTNYVGDSWEIELAKPEKYGIAITDITGIDAVTADIYDQEMASSDGSIYTSSRATKRNIVISATLLPVTTVEEVRHLLYKMFLLFYLLLNNYLKLLYKNIIFHFDHPHFLNLLNHIYD